MTKHNDKASKTTAHLNNADEMPVESAFLTMEIEQ